VKLSDVKPGVAYYHDPAKDWRDYASYRAFKMVFDDVTTRYAKIGRFRTTYSPSPRGQYLKGIAKGDPGEEVSVYKRQDRETYVRFADLHGPWDEAVAERAAARVVRDAARAEADARSDAAIARAERLQARAAALGMTVTVRARGRGSEVAVTMTGDDLAAFLDRLDGSGEDGIFIVPAAEMLQKASTD
jgi:hypothetical protein